MLPPVFRSLRVLGLLNVVGVGAAIGAATGLVFGHCKGNPDFFRLNPNLVGLSAFDAGLPALLAGLSWAWVLRRRTSLGATPVRVGWLLTIPLAMMSTGLSSLIGGIFYDISLGFLRDGSARAETSGWFLHFVGGFFMGAPLWFPALLLVLPVFGGPIAWAQWLAGRGLAGEERGEWIIGSVVAVLSLVTLLLMGVYAPHLRYDQPWVQPWQSDLARMGAWMLGALSLLGLLCGVTATSLALFRERWRRGFVRDAESGKIAGFRVDETREGKVLLRVTPESKAGYRVVDLSEELVKLDHEGLALEATTTHKYDR